ncbi:MAG: TonB-dependent receptor [Ignavibacteria bacterium]|jgi:outer membrane receptor for ferrienterochelin and colicin
MKVRITNFLFVLLLFTVCQSLLYAGTTGKLAGVVTDAGTGEPLFGANVVIKGTTMGAATDFEGNFVILNVSPGIYTVVVSMISYQKVEYENIKISTDLTTNIDVRLQSSSVELETLVVTAERNLVIKDMTSSLSTTSADQIQNLPVQNVQQVLRLSAGVIEDNGKLHIRGGRSGEVAYWVDGIPATDVYNGSVGIIVENSAIQELQVISGTFNAEYGQAMSGIVNIITKDGTENYTGEVKFYGGDYISSDDKYSVYKKLVTEEDQSSGLTNVASSEKENPLEKVNPVLNGEFSLSGPVPFTSNDLTFFLNGRYFSDEGYYYGVNWYKTNGGPGDSSLVAMNPLVTNSIQTKLTYKLSNNIRLSYTLFWNKNTRDRTYANGNINSHNYKYVPYALPKSVTEATNNLFSLNHVLSSKTFYELRVSRYTTRNRQAVFDNPYQGVNYLASVEEDEDNGIVAETFDPFTEEGQAKLQSIIAQGGSYSYIIDPNGPEGYIASDLVTNNPTSYSFKNQGMDLTRSERSTAYWIGKLDLTSQVTKTHQLKFGAEGRFYKLKLDSYSVIVATDEDGTTITPFQPGVPEIGTINRSYYVREPKEFSIYAQDKIEFDDIIVNLGVRFDYFDANSVVPTDETDPNIYNPFKNDNIYANWVDMPDNYSGTIDQYISAQLEAGTIWEYTPEERRAFMQKSVDAKSAISPRLGIAFPITDRGVIHFSYGHFFQMPEFQYLFSNPDFILSSSAANTLFGNADLKPQKTVMYEIGLQQEITENVGVDLTLFYKDIRDWVGTSPLVKTARTSVEYSVYENKDYANVRGVTLKIEKRFVNDFSFRADYTYQVAEGTYSDPDDAFNAIEANEAPVLSLLPMNWDQTHTFNAQLIYRLRDWTFSLIGRYWSGQPYTPSFPVAETVGSSTVSGLTTNSARLPDQKIVDLTINKSFNLGKDLHFDVFLNVYNLLDQRDATNVYSDTGSPDYTTEINPDNILYNSDRVSTVEDYVLQPSWYTSPRQIQFGVIFGF